MMNDNTKIYCKAFELIQESGNQRLTLSVFPRSNETTHGCIFIREKVSRAIVKEYDTMNELAKDIDNGNLKRFLSDNQ